MNYLQMAEVAVYCMSKAALDMFTQCLSLGIPFINFWLNIPIIDWRIEFKLLCMLAIIQGHIQMRPKKDFDFIGPKDIILKIHIIIFYVDIIFYRTSSIWRPSECSEVSVDE